MLRRRATVTLNLLRHLETSQAAANAQESTRNYGHMPLAVKNNAMRKGPGGRSSVSGVIATVFGATGFLGRYVVNALARTGTQVVVPYRCDDIDMQHLRQMGDLGQIVCLPEFNVRDDELIRHAVSQSSVVINLMGAQSETWNYSYNDIHVDAARRVAEIAAASPLCERFVHVSALGAHESASSMRLKSKAEGEQAVLDALPNATILSPGYMIGIEDRFFNLIASLGKSLPYVPVIDGGDTKVQPVYVRDVAVALIQVLRNYETCGKTYNLAGPNVISMMEAVNLVYSEMKEKSTTVSVPSSLARMAVLPHTLLYKKLPLHYFSYFLTADFINELSQDNVMPQNVLSFADLGIEPQSVIKGLPIDHIRFWRAGGYDFGATAGTEDA